MATSELTEADVAQNGAPKDMPSQAAKFPLKTALAICVTVAMLGVWRAEVDRSKGFDARTVAEAFQLKWPARPAAPVPARPRAAPYGLIAGPISPVFSDGAGNLDSFYAALWNLEQGNGGIVTVLHYGDSPTTADLITGDVRAQLQRRFGDAGRGYTLVAKPWAWYGHRGVEMSDHGWSIRTGVGLVREGVYGLGGAAFEGKAGTWSRFRLTEGEESAVDVEYLAKPGGGSFSVEGDDGQLTEQSTGADAETTASVHVPLPIGTKAITIRTTEGSVTLFGADFRRGSRGVLYDSLGLNGATTSVLSRVMEPELWKQELDRAAPALVVVNYGSNESSFGSFVHKQYGSELRLAIQRIRQVTPKASILVMSPMDRGERRGLDEIATMSTIPEIVGIQRQVAADMGCAFFDTYDAMGGDGTMARWYAASPRLVTADLLHPTPQGATIVAGLFVDQLGLGYDGWKMRHGITLPTATAAATTKTQPGNGAAKPAKTGRGGKKKTQ